MSQVQVQVGQLLQHHHLRHQPRRTFHLAISHYRSVIRRDNEVITYTTGHIIGMAIITIILVSL